MLSFKNVVVPMGTRVQTPGLLQRAVTTNTAGVESKHLTSLLVSSLTLDSKAIMVIVLLLLCVNNNIFRNTRFLCGSEINKTQLSNAILVCNQHAV